MGRYDAIIERLTAFAADSDDIMAAIILGSQARTDTPADEYSDLDVVLVVRDPEPFLASDEWIGALGQHRISFVEPTLGGLQERRVLFEGGLDVDFVIMPVAAAEQIMGSSEGMDIFRRGCRILIDKAGLAPYLEQCDLPRSAASPPTEAEFANVVQDFWYHTVWLTKKLLRGELWMAKSCLDVYLKNLLRWMIELHTHARRGWDCDTWHNGRFLEKWADPRIVRALGGAFAHYDRADVRRALLHTMDLFHWVSAEVAEALDFTHSGGAEQYARQWIAAHPIPEITRIYLIRHCETDWTEQRKLQGREDIPLNENGIRNAQNLASHFAGIQNAVVLSSPLSRAMETAKIIAASAGVGPVHAMPGLMERDYGKASGLTPDERSALYPDGNYEGMEPMDALRQRIYGALTEAAQRFSGRNIIAVSHGGAINAFLSKVSNGEIGSGKTRLQLGCVSMIEHRDGELRIVYYNKTAPDFDIRTL